ncbi:hypothetical protein BY996DRAFT_6551807 [Phakopsora pachyrhizi]|nr:hypothetical protein BY996DRAFT_6551807 [Phakopsora pachyrhizi]
MKTIDLESKPLDQLPPNNIPAQISKPHSDQTLQISIIANDANNVTGRPSGNLDWATRPKFIRRFSSNSSSIQSSSSTTTAYSLLLFSSKVEVSELEDLENDELIGRMFEQIHQQNHQPGDPNAISSTSEKVDITNRTNLERFYILAPQEIFQNL